MLLHMLYSTGDIHHPRWLLDKKSEKPTEEYLHSLDAALAAGLQKLVVLTIPTKVRSKIFDDSSFGASTKSTIDVRFLLTLSNT